MLCCQAASRLKPSLGVVREGGPRGGGFGGAFGMSRVLGWDGLKDELKLSEDQQAKIQEIVQQSSPSSEEMTRIFSQMRGASDEERAALQQNLQQEAQKRTQQVETQLQQVLSQDQFNRLKQVSRQQTGTRGLVDEENASKLGLSADQKTRLQGILEESDRNRFEMFRLSDEERTARQQEIDQSLLGILTPEQKQAWQDLLGPAASGLESLRFGGRGGDRRGGGERGSGGRSGAESGTNGPSSSTPANGTPNLASSEGGMPAPENGASGSVMPANSMSANSQSGDDDLFSDLDDLAETVPAGPAVIDFGVGQLAETTASPDGAQTVSFNFQNAPWEKFSSCLPGSAA